VQSFRGTVSSVTKFTSLFIHDLFCVLNESLQPLPLHDHTDMRRFELEVDGHIAFTEYERTGKRIFLVHTEVPKELEGQGVGAALVEKEFQFIEAHGWKFIPYCPYVKTYLRRHPEWNRILDHGIRIQ
jgi:hypothetical protein